MPKTYHPQWRDENAEIRYPFEDECTLSDHSSQLFLTDDWLVDAAVYSPVAQPPVYVSRIEVYGNSARVELSDSVGQLLGHGMIVKQSTMPIAVLDSNDLTVATLVPSESANASVFSAGDGEFLFSPAATTIIASCVLENPAASLQGFRVGDELYLQNEIILVGEGGVQLTMEAVQEVDAQGDTNDVSLVRIHAVGDAQRLTAECDDPSRRPARFIQEVVFQYGDMTHSCFPDEYGNIVLMSASPAVEDSALRVQNMDNRIRLELMGRGLS